jgi:hypothetical protein
LVAVTSAQPDPLVARFIGDLRAHGLLRTAAQPTQQTTRLRTAVNVGLHQHVT